MIRSLNIWFAALLLPVAMCVGGVAQAQEDAKRIAVMRFTGPSAGAFQGQVTQALKQRSEVELVSASEVKGTAERLGNSLANDTDYREVGEALELSAFIEGEVAKKGRSLQATVRVRDAASGAVVHEEIWNRRRSQVKTLKPVVWSALGPAIAETSPPAPKAKPKPAPIVTKPKPIEHEPAPRPRPQARWDDEGEAQAREEKASPRATGRSVRHPALVLALGPGLLWRNLDYTGDTQFNSYKNQGGSPGVVAAIRAQYYPGAHVSNRWYSDLGLDVDMSYALGLKSVQNGEKLDTTAYDLGVGAIYRIPIGDFEPRLRLGYLRQVFDVDVSANTLLPAVTYSAVRMGLELAIHFVDWLTFDASFAYLHVLGTGELERPIYGEDVATWGLEAGGGFLLRFKEVYGLRLGLDYRRYMYDFGLSDSEMVQRLPKSGSDGYTRLTLAFVYSLPGAAN